jgi:hypothetical protein
MEKSFNFMDELYDFGGGWTEHVNIAIVYYIVHAYVFFGRSAKGYYTSLASGVVF